MSESAGQSKKQGSSAPKEPLVDRRSADIGIVCTHRGELKYFLKRVDRQRSYTDRKITVRGGFLGETTRVVIAEAGEGFAAHRAAAELLVSEHHPAWLISAGYSSSLSDDIRPGDLVIADEISDTHVGSMPVKCTIAPRKRIHVGKLIVADHHPVTAADKAGLRERFPGLAADTGSLAVGQVCQEREVRFLAVRAVVDALNETIPEQAARMIFQPTSRALGSALGTMFKSLRNVSEMKLWRERSQSAAGNLDRFLTGAVEQIAEAIELKRLSR